MRTSTEDCFFASARLMTFIAEKEQRRPDENQESSLIPDASRRVASRRIRAPTLSRKLLAILRRRQHRSKDLLLSRWGGKGEERVSGRCRRVVPRRVENRLLHAHLFSSASLAAEHCPLYDPHSAKLEGNFRWLSDISLLRGWACFRPNNTA